MIRDVHSAKQEKGTMETLSDLGYQRATVAIEMPPLLQQPHCPVCGHSLSDTEQYNRIIFFCNVCRCYWLTRALAHEGVRDGVRLQLCGDGDDLAVRQGGSDYERQIVSPHSYNLV